MTIRFVALVAALASGCDCAGPHVPGGRCDDPEPPDGCGDACTTILDCPGGFYCHSSGVCTSDCMPGASTEECMSPSVCRDDGRCIPPGVDGGPVEYPDASVNCADVTVQATRVTPNVILIVDQSGSMDADFAGLGTRWDVLRDALIGSGGLVEDLQGVVRFGVALYTAEADGNTSDPVPGECPMITWVDPALDNLANISAVYLPGDWVDETPTGQSIDAVMARLASIPDPSTDPTIFILATDGEPDTCEMPNPQMGQQVSIDAVTRAFNAGIRTFIIVVGNDVGEAHAQDIANAGRGMPIGTSCPVGECYFRPDNDMALRDTMRAIVGGQLSCVVTLRGMIEDVSQACTGTVEINDMPLVCDDPNGWRVIDSTHIELTGEACTLLQNTPGVRLEARFPCDIILI